MGTRFLAETEARIGKGYQNEVVRATDGATSTVRTQLYNHLRGTFGWPEEFSPRTLISKSWVDHEAGVPFDTLKQLHNEAAKIVRGDLLTVREYARLQGFPRRLHVLWTEIWQYFDVLSARPLAVSRTIARIIGGVLQLLRKRELGDPEPRGSPPKRYKVA